jgi:hypothetical protein
MGEKIGSGAVILWFWDFPLCHKEKEKAPKFPSVSFGLFLHCLAIF